MLDKNVKEVSVLINGIYIRTLDDELYCAGIMSDNTWPNDYFLGIRKEEYLEDNDTTIPVITKFESVLSNVQKFFGAIGIKMALVEEDDKVELETFGWARFDSCSF